MLKQKQNNFNNGPDANSKMPPTIQCWIEGCVKTCSTVKGLKDHIQDQHKLVDVVVCFGEVLQIVRHGSQDYIISREPGSTKRLNLRELNADPGMRHSTSTYEEGQWINYQSLEQLEVLKTIQPITVRSKKKDIPTDQDPDELSLDRDLEREAELSDEEVESIANSISSKVDLDPQSNSKLQMLIKQLSQKSASENDAVRRKKYSKVLKAVLNINLGAQYAIPLDNEWITYTKVAVQLIKSGTGTANIVDFLMNQL